MINDYNEFKNFIKSLDKRPSLLLHACCAPCSTHCLKVLKDYFDITIFFSNDNIFPISEYDKRLKEIINFAKEYDNINVIDSIYNHTDFLNQIKGKEELGERSIRCYECYKLRMEKTIKYAKDNNFDFYTTTLSLSPYKNSNWINEIGYELELKYKVKYLYSNFKKENGYNDSISMSKDYDLYRQDYCGCEFSKKEREEACDRTKEKN